MWGVVGVAAMCFVIYLIWNEVQASQRRAAKAEQKRQDDASGVTAQREADEARRNHERGRREYQEVIAGSTAESGSDEARWEAAIAYEKHMHTGRPNTEVTLKSWQDARLKWAADLVDTDVTEFGNLVALACVATYLDSAGGTRPGARPGAGAVGRANDFHRYAAARGDERNWAFIDWRMWKLDFVAAYGTDETKAECARHGLPVSR